MEKTDRDRRGKRQDIDKEKEEKRDRKKDKRKY